MSCCEKIIEAAGKMTPCECATAGYCPRLGCTLNEYGHGLCRSSIGHNHYWTRETAPCMEGSSAPAVPQPFTLGVGDVVAWLIRVVTFGRVAMCSSCEGRKAWLNRFRIWPWGQR